MDPPGRKKKAIPLSLPTEQLYYALCSYSCYLSPPAPEPRASDSMYPSCSTMTSCYPTMPSHLAVPHSIQSLSFFHLNLHLGFCVFQKHSTFQPIPLLGWAICTLPSCCAPEGSKRVFSPSITFLPQPCPLHLGHQLCPPAYCGASMVREENEICHALQLFVYSHPGQLPSICFS